MAWFRLQLHILARRTLRRRACLVQARTKCTETLDSLANPNKSCLTRPCHSCGYFFLQLSTQWITDTHPFVKLSGTAKGCAGSLWVCSFPKKQIQWQQHSGHRSAHSNPAVEVALTVTGLCRVAGSHENRARFVLIDHLGRTEQKISFLHTPECQLQRFDNGLPARGSVYSPGAWGNATAKAGWGNLSGF